MIMIKLFVDFVVGAYRNILEHDKDASMLQIIIRLLKIIYNRAVYKFDSNEYFYYHIENISTDAKRMLYPKYYQARLYYKVNSDYARRLATDKYESYLKFKSAYMRDVCVWDPECRHEYNKDDEKLQLQRFIQRHKRFIVKPLFLNSGKGIRIFDTDSFQSDKDAIDSLVSQYHSGFIAEELIVQSKWFANFHPNSVNTVRIQTVLLADGRIDCIYPCFRIGVGDSVVDNAGSGGIFVAIDKDTGRTIAAADEFGRSFVKHPDTSLSLIDCEIPCWNDACKLVMDLASNFTECKIIGWDLAMTDKGWCIVEVNAHPLLIYQIATQKGIRKDMEELIDRI